MKNRASAPKSIIFSAVSPLGAPDIEQQKNRAPPSNPQPDPLDEINHKLSIEGNDRSPLKGIRLHPDTPLKGDRGEGT